MDLRNILSKLDQLNEGSMSSAKKKPAGPNFVGKMKGTDPASAAKDKYVGGSMEESIFKELEATLRKDPEKRDLFKEFREFKEAYDHNAPFNAADFNRHMEQLRAREELRKTDPMKALVGDLIDKDNAARNVKKKPQDDDSIGINDPRHPQYAYTQAGQQGVEEGSIGDKIKGAAKSIKRAVQWDSGPEMVTPAGTVKAFKNMDGQHLANFVASRKELSTPRKGSARAFADKVIDREMKQRGYGRVADKGEQGVAESYDLDAFPGIKFLNPKTGQMGTFFYWSSTEGKNEAYSMITNKKLVAAHDDGTPMTWDEYKQALDAGNKGVTEDVDAHWIPDVVTLLGKLVASSKAQAKYNVEPADIPDVKEFINLLSAGNLDAARDHWSMMEWNDLDNALEYFVRKNGLPHVWLHKLLGEHNVDEGAEEALAYATKAHAGQTRSGGDPYITHPMRVADHIRQYKQSHNLDALISAAYLHDTIEDTDTTQEVLHDLFGGLVASLVKELTSDPEQIKKMGKAQYLSHKMAVMSSYALVIKLADRLDNVKDITTARTPQWRAKYAAETNQILDYIEKTRALSGTHKKLISLIRAKLAEIDHPQQGVTENFSDLDLAVMEGGHELVKEAPIAPPAPGTAPAPVAGKPTLGADLNKQQAQQQVQQQANVAKQQADAAKQAKLDQANLQKGVNSLKSAGAAISNPGQTAQAFNKVDANAALTPGDKTNIASAGTVLAPIMANQQLAGKFKDLVNQASAEQKKEQQAQQAQQAQQPVQQTQTQPQAPVGVTK